MKEEITEVVATRYVCDFLGKEVPQDKIYKSVYNGCFNDDLLISQEAYDKLPADFRSPKFLDVMVRGFYRYVDQIKHSRFVDEGTIKCHNEAAAKLFETLHQGVWVLATADKDSSPMLFDYKKTKFSNKLQTLQDAYDDVEGVNRSANMNSFHVFQNGKYMHTLKTEIVKVIHVTKEVIDEQTSTSGVEQTRS